MQSWRETALNMGYAQGEWPAFRLLMDPVDFLVPQVWSPGDPRWLHAENGGRIAQLCNWTNVRRREWRPRTASGRFSRHPRLAPR